jgi:hypothetical protein
MFYLIAVLARSAGTTLKNPNIPTQAKYPQGILLFPWLDFLRAFAIMEF